jgi:hypothetical protein
MWGHYIYLHRRADTGEPFYIGKGKMRRGWGYYERAHAPRVKNKHWMNIVAKHGLAVEILAHCKSDQDAQYVERLLIAQIGRASLGKGPLINKTDGGDGHAGIIASEELRAKRRLNSSGKRSGAWVASIREARKNGGNGGVVKRGDKLPIEWVGNIAKAKIGPLNHRFGKPSPRRKAVIDRATGIVYPSISAAAVALGRQLGTVHAWVTGIKKNPTSLELFDG